MSGIDALADPALFSDLDAEYPRGMSLRRMNAKAFHALVQRMTARLREMGIRLRLELEPPHFPGNNPHRPIPEPKRLVVSDADLSWQVDLELNDTLVFLGSRVVSTAGEGGVARLAAGITTAIKRVLNIA